MVYLWVKVPAVLTCKIFPVTIEYEAKWGQEPGCSGEEKFHTPLGILTPDLSARS